MRQKPRDRSRPNANEPMDETLDSTPPSDYSAGGKSGSDASSMAQRSPMEESTSDGTELRSIVRGVSEEFVQAEQAKAEPAYKAESLDERKRREHLERRVDELIQENQRSRELAEEASRSTAIRSELQRLGVAKVDLAYRAVKDDVQRAEDGRLTAHGTQGEMPLRDYLVHFVQENPELLPARIAGGSGMGSGPKTAPNAGGFDLDKIRVGMSKEDLEKA